MSKSFYIGRMGNKKDDIKYFKHLLPLDIKTIVEPFGGSFAVSRIVYNDEKYKKVISDTDDELYELYTKPNDYIECYNKMVDARNSLIGENGDMICEKTLDLVDKVFTNEKLKNNFKKARIIRGCIFNINKTPFQVPELKNYEFYNDDYLKVIKKYQHDKEAFIFLDPPYLFSDNSHYKEQKKESGDYNHDNDSTVILINILKAMENKKTKAKIMLVINRLKIIEYLFKNFKMEIYNKIYQLGKKKAQHLIITNY